MKTSLSEWKSLIFASATMALCQVSAQAQATNTGGTTTTGGGGVNSLSWSNAFGDEGGAVGKWIKGVVYMVMAVFIMVSIILGSLAFKQLAADGNWKEFWSKIAGAIGMFVTPIAVAWLVTK